MKDIYAKDGLFTVGLGRELGLYREIEALAARERAVLQEADPASKLLPLLERKNEILGEIAQIENSISGFKAGWKTDPRLSADDRERISALVREIGDVLRGLISGEISAEETFNEKYPGSNGAESAVSHRGVGGVAMAAYGRK